MNPKAQRYGGRQVVVEWQIEAEIEQIPAKSQMIIFLIGAGTIDPIEFVAQRQNFEFF